MLKLVLKDFQIQKKSFLNYAFIATFLSFFFAMSGMAQMTFAMVTFPIVYGFINRALYEDEKNNTLRLLVSLPVRRKTVVHARYVSAAAIILIMALVCTAINILLNAFGVTPLQETGNGFIILAFSMLAMVFLISVYLPIAFRLGSIKAANINRFLFIGIFAASTGASIALQRIPKGQPPEFIIRLVSMFQSISIVEILLILSAAAVCTFLISMQLSIRFFEKRELF